MFAGSALLAQPGASEKDLMAHLGESLDYLKALAVREAAAGILEQRQHPGRATLAACIRLNLGD
jgi:hypothetical protein